jgi:DNA-binding beta-propeller fold protein YncE
LYRIEANDSATLLASGSNIAGVAVDPQTGHIFATEDFDGIIYRTELTGTGRTTWVDGFHTGDDDPVGMAFAPALYSGSVISPGDGLVMDRGFNGLDDVWRFSPDVAEGETAVHSDDGTLVDSVDIAIGLNDIYLVDDKDAEDGAIYRLDTGGALTEIPTTIPLPAPEGITIDPLTGNLLVLDIVNQKVYDINLVTGVVVDMLPGFVFNFPSGSSWAGIDISPDGQQLIISDKGPDLIYVFTRATN